MPKSICKVCEGPYYWKWEDAFKKFGFGDGDGQVQTEIVADVLRAAGYQVTTSRWGMHNEVIDSITCNRIELIPFGKTRYGYDDPRNFLPNRLVKLLDRELPELAEVQS